VFAPYQAEAESSISIFPIIKAGLQEFAYINEDVTGITKDDIENFPESRAALAEHKNVSQTCFSRFEFALDWERLFARSSQSARARLLSLSSPGAQAWMQATPEKGLFMRSMSVLVACRRALGLPLPFARPLSSRVRRCQFCPTNPEIDAEGYHLSICKANSSATRLHNRMNHEVMSMHSECGRCTSTHVTSWFDNKPYPDGVVYGGGDDLIVDTSIRTPLRVDLLASTASKAGHAAALGEVEKERLYSALCKDRGFVLLPAVFESFGAIGKRLAEHMKELEDQYFDKNVNAEEVEGRGSFVSRWRERFSVALQNGFARKLDMHCAFLRIPLSLSPVLVPPPFVRTHA
jgi:hypothetical protein